MARQSSGRFDVAPAKHAGETSGLARIVATLVAVALIGTVACAGPAAAAGSTGVALDPANATVDPGANVSLDVVITDTAGGVGAYNLSVEVANPEVASIAAVETVGRPGLENVTREAEHATVLGGLLDTNDTGAVTVARVVLAGASEGRTTVSVEVNALADEDGEPYTVTSTHDGTVSVGEATSGADSVSGTDSASGATRATNNPGTTNAPQSGGDGNTTDGTTNAASTDTTVATAVALENGRTHEASGRTHEATGTTTAFETTENSPKMSSDTTEKTGNTAVEESTERAPTSTTTGSGPGFGVVAAGGALLVFGVGRLFAHRA